jgi:hypothetical protein
MSDYAGKRSSTAGGYEHQAATATSPALCAFGDRHRPFSVIAIE